MMLFQAWYWDLQEWGIQFFFFTKKWLLYGVSLQNLDCKIPCTKCATIWWLVDRFIHNFAIWFDYVVERLFISQNFPHPWPWWPQALAIASMASGLGHAPNETASLQSPLSWPPTSSPQKPSVLQHWRGWLKRLSFLWHPRYRNPADSNLASLEARSLQIKMSESWPRSTAVLSSPCFDCVCEVLIVWRIYL